MLNNESRNAPKLCQKVGPYINQKCVKGYVQKLTNNMLKHGSIVSANDGISGPVEPSSAPVRYDAAICTIVGLATAAFKPYGTQNKKNREKHNPVGTQNASAKY